LYWETLDYRQEAESVTYTENSFGHKTCTKFIVCELAWSLYSSPENVKT